MRLWGWLKGHHALPCHLALNVEQNRTELEWPSFYYVHHCKLCTSQNSANRVCAMISPKSTSFNFKIQHDAVSSGSSDVLIIYNLRRQRDDLSRFRDVSFESHHQHPLTAVPSKRWETSRHVCDQTFPACLCPPIYPLSHIAPRSQHIHCRVSGPQWSQTFWWEWQRQALFYPASKSVWFLPVTVHEKEKNS